LNGEWHPAKSRYDLLVAVDKFRTDVYEEEDSEDELPWALTVLASPDLALESRVIPIEGGLTMGRRSAGVDLEIEDGKLSRRHAEVKRQGNEHEVIDLNSTNGTFVNGRRVAHAVLDVGAVLRVGETLFEVGPAVSAPVGNGGELVGCSSALRQVLSALDKVAATSLTVLIVGETGVGKELMARRLHQKSGRSGPLVAVNCGAVPANLFESALFGHKKGAFTDAVSDAPGHFSTAEGGTLFLDEIGVMPIEVQPKLLRVLESHEFAPVGSTQMRRSRARVVAATNVDFGSHIDSGQFRRDLYARLSEYVIRVPPLRQRRADIPLLLRHFLQTFAPKRRFGFSATFMEALVLYEWPMNVRELRAVVQRLALLDEDVTVLKLVHLPPELRAEARATPPTGEAEPSREELEQLLKRFSGNVAQLARHVGKERMQVYRWLRRHGIDAASFRVDES
jgi:transcriptional regulator with GAF, ATPase, and Fis domain